MQKRELLEKINLCPLGLGGAALSGEAGGYGFGTLSEKESIALLHAALDLGVELYDTAPVYGFGESERRLGKAFLKCRDKVFIVDKGGVTWHANRRIDINNSATVMEQMLHQSLSDLKTDYIDLYLIHWPDPRHPLEDALAVLIKAKTAGKIRHIGLSNTNDEDLKKARAMTKIDVIQGPLSFLERGGLPFYQESACALMTYGTLDKGILTGRVKEGRRFDASDCRSFAPWWKSMDKAWRYELVAELEPLLQAAGFSLLHLALSYNLSFPFVHTALCGAKSIPDLKNLLEALRRPLPQELLNAANDLWEQKRK